MAQEGQRQRLPPGLHFRPTDIELAEHYFLPKLQGKPLPCEIVANANVYDHHPGELLGFRHEAYFFTQRKPKHPNGARPDRQAGDGYWKPSSGVQRVVPGINKTALVYFEGSRLDGERTDWLMHEYTATPESAQPPAIKGTTLRSWVLCKVYKKKGSQEAGSEDQEEYWVPGEEWQLQIPPGIRFVPTDEVLAIHYFRPKLLGQPLPYEMAAEANVYDYHPAVLLGSTDEAYFFTRRRRKHPNGTRPDRSAGGGFWRTSSGVQPVVQGISKSALVYYEGKRPTERKTHWLMHEYTESDGEFDRWVLCKIYRKKATKEGEDSEGSNEAIDSEEYDQPAEGSSPSQLPSPWVQEINDLMREDNLLRNILTDNQVRPSPAAAAAAAAGGRLCMQYERDPSPLDPVSVLDAGLPHAVPFAPVPFTGYTEPEASTASQYACPAMAAAMMLFSSRPLGFFDPAGFLEGGNRQEVLDGDCVMANRQEVLDGDGVMANRQEVLDGECLMANRPEAIDDSSISAVVRQYCGGLAAPRDQNRGGRRW